MVSTARQPQAQLELNQLNWGQVTAFSLFHLMAIGLLFVVDWSWFWLGTVFVMHQIRFFGISVVIHRYFSHRAFETSRSFQFILALIGNLSLIRGPIRFASAHRYHHRHSDTNLDIHSPRHGFLWAYMGWLMSPAFDENKLGVVRDLRKYPELVWLDRLYWLPALVLGLYFYAIWGLEGFVWAGMVSTITTWHLAFFITSVFHRVGHQDFETGDQSRNNLWLALLTQGEGWHNNHHHDMHSAQIGYQANQPDFGYWSIWLMEKLGLIWHVKRFRPEGSHSPLKLSKD